MIFTEEINDKINIFLNERNICIGNYTDIKLFKLGNVYQYILVYAELIEE
ncbi:unnamed protein product [marine sediment metagenome]|uniref:Uncharacterized protein n=1 Tax=marine sediment metagenome TaxID=412755 RepID=X0S9T8_9ZZZZ